MSNLGVANTPTINYQASPNPDVLELQAFLEDVFSVVADSDHFADDQDQKLSDWFSVDELIKYLPYGRLIEARLEDNILVGVIFIGQQHPVSWPDGKKMEIFVLGVHQQHRRKNIALTLIQLAEEFAQQVGAKKIIVNTHVLMNSVHTLYRRVGYEEMGRLTAYYDNGDALFFQKSINDSTAPL